MQILHIISFIKTDNIILTPTDFTEITHGNLTIKNSDLKSCEALKISFLGSRVLKDNLITELNKHRKLNLKYTKDIDYVFSIEKVIFKNFFKEDLKIIVFIFILSVCICFFINKVW
ncbi:hypothetical protein CDIK_0638 [Cucumispora dikerogammari]|nr:hypothetical protein CDIK_0638 [Cucumispora dikerogammari]